MTTERKRHKTSPCAYCSNGGRPVLDWLKTVGIDGIDLPVEKCWKVVKCVVCGCQGPMDKDECEAVRKWNDRKSVPPALKTVYLLGIGGKTAQNEDIKKAVGVVAKIRPKVKSKGSQNGK